MSTSTDIVAVETALLEHISHHEQTAGLTLTERIRLTERISTEVVARRGGTIEDALTALETLGTIKGASLGAIMRLTDAGLPYLNAHNLMHFCAQMGINVEFGREWLRFFEVTMQDDEEIESVIIMVGDLISWIKRTEHDPIQREINKKRDNASFLEMIRELSVHKNAPTIESLCDALGV